MNFKKLRRVVTIGSVVCVVLCAGALGCMRWSIQNGLDEWCARAQAAHPLPS
jgi:hypothetical protein